MDTRQPVWKLLANLGDAHPIDHGGYFIFEDETGVYDAEGEKLFAHEGPDSGGELWEVYRFSLDRLKIIHEGETVYLVPARFDTSWPYSAAHYDEWFHEDLYHVADYVGQTVEELREAFCSSDAKVRAMAYEAVGQFHGFENLDSYPLRFTDRAEVEARYTQPKYTSEVQS